MATKAFTMNSKTLLSIDFDRFKTCPQICDYCYVGNMERIYPAYKAKISHNVEWAKSNPKDFAQALNQEYRSYRKSKSRKLQRLSKLPVRIYGSGDFVPEHLEFMKQLEFKFYIISKTLTDPKMDKWLHRLITLPNLTKVILSMDDTNMQNFAHTKKYYKQDKYGISYTGYADNFDNWKTVGFFSDIFFNISKKKIEREKSKKIKEQCPCDSGSLKHDLSCSYCNKCWRSSVTRGKSWNHIGDTYENKRVVGTN